MIWLPVIAAVFVLIAAIGVRAAGVAPTVPNEPGPEFVGRAAALTFDQHAAVAAALLQPDVPLFTAAQLAHIHVADEAEAWLRDKTTRES